MKKIIILIMTLFLLVNPIFSEGKAMENCKGKNYAGISDIKIQGTNSMYPTIKEGEKFCFQYYDTYKKYNKLKVGDIIVFGKSKYDYWNLVIHRISYAGLTPNGKNVYITWGDNNRYDDGFVYENQIRWFVMGKV